MSETAPKDSWLDRYVEFLTQKYVSETGRPEPFWVGVKEIADRLNVPRDRVAMWVHRGKLPPHKHLISGNSKAWDWYDIEQWAKDNTRLAP